MLYPLLMAPFFRHGAETPWGGHMLRDIFMKDAPEDDVTGESLEISVLPGHESLVANGPHAGKTLTRMIEMWGEDLTGPIDGEFPLLLKLLDAQEPLSVQVHPDDAYAMEHEGKLGKTEAWIIFNAEPDSRIVYGVDMQGEDLREVVESGRIESVLHWEKVMPGDVFYMPSGMVHALGAGIQCYEIQQSSDVTYRLFDWNRVIDEKNCRELHIEKALEAVKPELAPRKIGGTTVLCKGGSRTYYICDNHLELSRLHHSGTMPLESGRMLFLTPMAPCTVRWSDGVLEVKAFESVLIPAALQGVQVEGNTKVLVSCLPDKPALRAMLDYRAENVAGLMEN